MFHIYNSIIGKYSSTIKMALKLLFICNEGKQHPKEHPKEKEL